MNHPNDLPSLESLQVHTTPDDQLILANYSNEHPQSNPREIFAEQPDNSHPQHSLNANRFPDDALQLTHNSIVPNDVRDPRQHAGGRSFKNVGPGPSSGSELVPSCYERIGAQQLGTCESMESTNPLNTSENPNKSHHDDMPHAIDGLNASPFRAFSVDDEEQKRRILGTYLDTRFPEIPDIFLNSQDYISLNGPSRAETALREESVYNSNLDLQNTTEIINVAQGTTTALEDGDEQDARAYNVYIDPRMSRNISSDIVSQLGHMPVNSLNAFMDGEDKIGERVPNVTRHEGAYILKNSANHLVKGGLTLRTPETDAKAIGNGEDQAMPEFGSTYLSESQSHRGLLYGKASEQECDREAFSSDCLLSGDSSPNETVGPNEQSHDNDCNLTNDFALRDLTNCQTESQELSSYSMEEFCLQLNEFSRKMRRQPRYGCDNLKYYSLRRMQKDLNENLVLSEQLFSTVSKLREHRANLDEACRKEREEIKRLHEILGERELVPMKDRQNLQSSKGETDESGFNS